MKSSQTIHGRPSIAQDQLLFLDQLEPGNTAYHIPSAFRVRGELNIEAIKQSFTDLIHRHDSLRTRFFYEHGESRTEISAEINDDSFFQYHDVRHQGSITDEAIDALLIHSLKKPFDLSKQVIRVELFQIGCADAILLVNIHHIVADGRSLSILFDEFKHCYERFSQNKASELSAPGLSYHVYATQQRKDEQLDEQTKSFWRKTLENAPEQLNLATDVYNSSFEAYEGASIAQSHTGQHLSDLKQLAKQLAASPFLICLAATITDLYLHSWQEDMMVGVPFMNRANPQVADTVGLFVHVLPIRVKINPEQSFADIVEQLKLTLRDVIQRQNFSSDIAKLQKNTAQTAPLFRVMITQTFSNTPIITDSVRFEPIKVQRQSVAYDLSYYIQINQAVEVELEYRKNLFTIEAAKAYADSWSKLLNSVCEDPQVNIESLGSPTKLTLNFPPIDQHPSLIERFETIVAEQGDKLALIQDDQSISYRELWINVNKIAHQLQARQIAKGQVVAVLMNRSINRVASILAILKCGGLFLSLSPDLPASRNQTLLKQANAQFILCEQADEYDTPCLDVNAILRHTQTQSVPNVAVSAKDNAYVIFTSGSSGAPKGILGKHAGIMNRVDWALQTYPFKANEMCCHQASVMFVDAIAELFVPLLAGIPAVIIPEETKKNPLAYIQLLQQYDVSRLLSIPSYLGYLIETCQQERIKLEKLSLWMVSGEPLPLDIVNRFKAYFPHHTLVNVYGSSEVSADVCAYEIPQSFVQAPIPIGKPLSHTVMGVFDSQQRPLENYVIGEFYVFGHPLASGYLNHDEGRFIELNINGVNHKAYRTGDCGYRTAAGEFVYLSRMDRQIKLRGVRIECAEIEAVLKSHPLIHDAMVHLDEHATSLVAQCVSQATLSHKALRAYCAERLPEVMIPAVFYYANEIARTVSGKVDRQHQIHNLMKVIDDALHLEPFDEVETKIINIWQSLLNSKQVSLYDSFFDLGGHSLKLIDMQNKLNACFEKKITVAQCFEFTTISQLAKYYRHHETKPKATPKQQTVNDDIAIIGMAAKFPDAEDVETFWHNLLHKKSSIHPVDSMPMNLSSPKTWVNKSGQLEDIERFDAKLFKFKPHEAEILDPQQRVLLEVAWCALENAAYDPDTYPGAIGLYASGVPSTYLLNNLYHHLDIKNPGELFAIMTSTSENYLATRVAYKLNLRGPCASIQTACSSSLVSVHMACRTLQAGDADIMLAGGVSVKVPQNLGYVHEPGSIVSPDGICKPFDETADGTVFSDGAGIVVLKRLTDAVADGDQIYAVIKGSAMNNDGHLKNGYAAPSPQGQVDVINRALNNASVDPADVSYIETHGTGTALGDPIELSALNTVYKTNKPCVIGSVKANIGHCDSAAGIAGLIKASLVLHHRKIPATINFQQPTSKFDWADSQLTVNTETLDWQQDDPRYAAVSSLGIGGTNAHVLLKAYEQPVESVSKNMKSFLITVSAQTPTACQAYRQRLLRYLQNNPDVNLADLAYTLQIGRKQMPYRWSTVCHHVSELIRDLSMRDPIKQARNEHAVFIIDDAHYLDELHRWGIQPSVVLERHALLSTDSEAPIIYIGEQETSLSHSFHFKPSTMDFHALIAHCWSLGFDIDWYQVYQQEKRRRLTLPNYPFERSYYWIDAIPRHNTHQQVQASTELDSEDLSQQVRMSLKTIWQEVLGIDDIHDEDDFYSLDGDSIVATQISTRASQLYPIDLPISIFLEKNTITQQAEAIERLLIDYIDSLNEEEIDCA